MYATKHMREHATRAGTSTSAAAATELWHLCSHTHAVRASVAFADARVDAPVVVCDSHERTMP